MAPTLVKKTRGHPNMQDKSKKDESQLEITMTEEDKLLLKDVNDDNDMSDVELDGNGNNISESEINSFLKKLNVSKYRPFPASEPAKKKQNKDTQNKTINNSSNDVSNASSKKGKVAKQVQQVSNASQPKAGMKDHPNVASIKNDPKNKIIKNSPKTPSVNEVNKAKILPNTEETKAVIKFLGTYKSRKHLLLKPEDMWREEQVHPLVSTPPDEKLVKEAENLSKRLLEDEMSIYSKYKEQSKRSEARWLKTVLASGTLSDKMAALTLLIQESPVHSLASIDTLISMARKKGRREAMMAVDTLRDLFLTGLLPDNRKLRTLNQQPLIKLQELASDNIDARDKYLLMWYFEGLIKKRYADFIKALGEMSFDTLQATKEKALSSIHQLLTSKPEQENTLLPMLVNKLGDAAIKSKATYLLTKLVNDHPNMKAVIVREVQQLLQRPNVSQRAQYNAICFLTQIRLSQTQGDLASQLIQIYFYFFQTCLSKGDTDNKMMSALLTGVNRAYVYAKERKEEIAEQIHAIYKIIPNVNFHTSVQALMLLFQVSDVSVNASDRYYTCLYRKLIDPALRNSSKQAIFMNLLFKSMKSDIVDKRIRAFIKRTLQIYSQQPVQVICGVLILLSQLLKEKPGLLDTKHIAREIWSDDEDEKFVDLKAPEEFDHPENGNEIDDDQQEPDITEADSVPETSVNGVIGSWVHRINYGGRGQTSEYDPYNRNPVYARAELDCLWEIVQLAQHYHPTVRLYASSILQGKHFEYDGDPLQDYTLIRFLDRFVYKNPKKESANTSHFKKMAPSGVRAIPVNTKEFLEIGEESVPEDEKFFYRYFTEKASRSKNVDDADSDGASVADDEFDAFLDGYEKYADRDEDFSDMDLDFAGDTYNKSKPKNKKKKKDEESDDESLDDDDLEDEELAAEFRQEMEGMDVGDDDDDDDDDEIDSDSFEQLGSPFLKDGFSNNRDGWKQKINPDGRGKKRKMLETNLSDFNTDHFGEPQKKTKRKHDTTDLFATAEQFAHLLEEGTESGQVSLGGTGDFRNKDKAAQKQLKWEADRDRWLSGSKVKGQGGHKRNNFKDGHRGGGTKSFAKNKFSKNREGKPLRKKFKSGKNNLSHKKKK